MAKTTSPTSPATAYSPTAEWAGAYVREGHARGGIGLARARAWALYDHGSFMGAAGEAALNAIGQEG